MLDNLFQPTHLLVILFIALLVFGQEAARTGQGIGRRYSELQGIDEREARECAARRREEAVGSLFRTCVLVY